MVPILSLWLPILLAAVLVFIASSLIHMVLGYHRSDIRGLPGEADVLETLRRVNVPAGDYAAPYAGSMEAMKDPAFLAKWKQGPVVYMTVQAGKEMSMGPQLAAWFAYSIVVGIFAAYIAGRALPAGAPYLDVFQIAGATAFVGYALALPQNSIWWKRNWGMTLKTMFDGLVYGLLTGGAFGWLWPS